MSTLKFVTTSAIALLSTVGARADDFDLSWWTIDTGGVVWSVGEDLVLGSTIGQPDASPVVMTGGNFVLVGGFWPAVTPILLGDCNCNGVVNFDDINPFVGILTGATPCFFPNADINGDGVINFDDINPFVALLSGAAGP